MSPVIVSFFSGPGYEAEAREMERTAREFGLFTDVRPVPDLGDWCRNCSQKPAFVRDRMRDYPGRPVIWLDADARVVRAPDLFRQLDCNFAAHWFRGCELISACCYFAPSAVELVRAWQRRCQDRPDVWDQKHLQAAVESMPSLKVERLPPAYNWIRATDYDLSEQAYGPVDPVIVQTQASRRLKERV